MKRFFISCTAFIVLLFGLLPSPTAALDSTPGVPRNVRVVPGLLSITVSWLSPAERSELVTSYVVRYSTNRGKSWSILDETNVRDTTAQINVVEQSAYYLIEVASVGSLGTSAWVSPLIKGSELLTATTLSSGGDISCAPQTSGRIKCWGGNSSQARGVEDLYDWVFSEKLLDGVCFGTGPYQCSTPFTTAVSVSLGTSSACALLDTGAVKCWEGLPFIGSSGAAPTIKPIQVSGIANAISIATGSAHFCSALVTGTVRCWGENDFGQLGSGDYTGSKLPIEVVGVADPISVAAGSAHTCALLASGKVNCWGRNLYGQLGNLERRTALSSNLPVEVSGITSAVAISSTADHACALLDTGEVRCWGFNGFGQLGNGLKEDSAVPVTVSGLAKASAISTGSSHSCALLITGGISCWGFNGFGQLGNGLKEDSAVPVTVSGLAKASAISTGSSHSCALLITGGIKCWGRNNMSQLGNGSVGSVLDTEDANSTIPVSVTGNWLVGFQSVQPPTPPSVSRLTKSATSIQVFWNDDSFADGQSVEKYRIRWSVDGVSWNQSETMQTTFQIKNLSPATSYQFQIAARSIAGWGEFGEPIYGFTSGTRTMRFGFRTTDGRPLSGGKISWELDDKSYYSSKSYGVTSNGVLDFPRVAAGWGKVKATNIELGDGTVVTGVWPVPFGKDLTVLTLPLFPISSRYEIAVKLPTGQPVVGAQVAVDGLLGSKQIGGFRFGYLDSATGSTATSLSGVTDSSGRFVARGFASGPVTARIVYDDQTLVQSKSVNLLTGLTEVVFDDMPWLEISDETKTASFNAIVPVTVALNETAIGTLVMPAMNLQGSIANSDSATRVSVLPPRGAKQSCKGRVLTSKVNAQGVANLRVCASKSGLYRLQGNGAVATGALTIWVQKAPPMPVNSLSALSPRLGTARIAWNPPSYTGGAPVKKYIVSLKGGGATIVRNLISKKDINSRILEIKNLRNATTYSVSVVTVTKYGRSDAQRVVVSVA